MPILFRCIHCRAKLSITSKKAGLMIVCPTCLKEVQVPSLDQIEERIPQTNKPAVSSNKPDLNAPPEPALKSPAAEKINPSIGLDPFQPEQAPKKPERPFIQPPPLKRKLSPPLPSQNPAVFAPLTQRDPLQRDPQLPAASGQSAPLDQPAYLEKPATEGPASYSPVDFSPVIEDLVEQNIPQPVTRDEDFSQNYQAETPETNLTEQASPPKKSPPKYIPKRNWEEVSEEDDDDILSAKTHLIESEELDLTPMVDVTFLLLIFFMLTCSFDIQKSIPIPQPDPSAQGKGAVQSIDIQELEKVSILVEINAENAITIDGTQIADYTALVTELVNATKQGEKIEVIIQPDPKALHEFVIKVIDASNEAGIQKIRLAGANES